MSMERVRIYDLAKELRTPSKDLLDLIKQLLNISLKSHSSSISGEQAEILKNHIKESRNKKVLPDKKQQDLETTTTPSNVEYKEQNKEAVQKMEIKQSVVLEDPPSVIEEKQTPPVNEEKKLVEPKQTTPQQPQQPQQQVQGSSFSQQSRYKQPLNLQKNQQKQESPPAQKSSSDTPYRILGDKYKHKPGTTTEEVRSDSKTESRGSKPVGRYGIKKPSTYFKETESNQQDTSPLQQEQIKQKQEFPETKTIEVETITQIAEEIKEELPVEKTQEKIKTETMQTSQLLEPELKEEHNPQEVKAIQAKPETTILNRPRHIGYPPKTQKPFFKQPRQDGKPFEKFSDKPSPKSQTSNTSTEIASKEASQSAKPAKTIHKKDFGKKKDYSQKDKHQELKPLSEIFKKKKPEKKDVVIEKPTEVSIDQPLTIAELSEKLVISSSEIIKELFKSGILATLNQNISAETAKDVSEKLGYTVTLEEPGKIVELTKDKDLEEITPKRETKDDTHRAPIVTIMGHVDHGKTTLLDTIRKTKNKIVDSEIGGITQSIGAYSAEIHGKKIVFIDTPGHEAFTAMRARGAKVTDIVIIIVAADDGIMPQTVEAISHAKASGVPIIVAVNKIDKAGADPDRVLQQLTEHNLLPEAWGGDIVTVPISAAKGDNIDELLEMILLVAELQELKANPKENATGVVIESILDKGKGPVACVLVQNGTLKVGDFILVGKVGGKVRALISDTGERLIEAGPSTPVEILGLPEVPSAGDQFEVINDDKTLKQLLNKRKELDKERRLSGIKQITLQQDTIFKAKTRNKKEDIKDLNIIIKADTDGSAKAVENALQELKSKEISVKIIHTGIGDISEADVMLAVTSNAMIIGFRVKEDTNAAKVSQLEGINVRTYEIIYQISEDIEKTMLGLLSPEVKEIELGKAEVRNLFTVGKNVVIAGCYVLEGKIVRNRTATVFRGNKEIFKGTLDNLKRFKDDAKEVASGYECGISFNKFNDLKEGDIIKVTTIEEIERASLN